jgi:glutamate synthase domain-containing protein 1
VEMAEETKFTLKIGVIASFIAALVVFMLSCLWQHNGDISRLQTNQITVMRNQEKMDAAVDKIPERLASIEANVAQLVRTQVVHSKVSYDNNKMLRSNGK